MQGPVMKREGTQIIMMVMIGPDFYYEIQERRLVRID
jgi:hypothetical protein